MRDVKVIEHGTWSWQGGEEQPAYVTLVKGRVWGSYCYRAVAESAAARLTGNENTSHLPTLAEYPAWQA